MDDRIAVVRDHRDAGALAAESSARRANRCPDCGMPAGSGLGPHYLGCIRADTSTVPEATS